MMIIIIIEITYKDVKNDRKKKEKKFRLKFYLLLFVDENKNVRGEGGCIGKERTTGRKPY